MLISGASVLKFTGTFSRRENRDARSRRAYSAWSPCDLSAEAANLPGHPCQPLKKGSSRLLRPERARGAQPRPRQPQAPLRRLGLSRSPRTALCALLWRAFSHCWRLRRALEVRQNFKPALSFNGFMVCCLRTACASKGQAGTTASAPPDTPPTIDNVLYQS